MQVPGGRQGKRKAGPKTYHFPAISAHDCWMLVQEPRSGLPSPPSLSKCLAVAQVATGICTAVVALRRHSRGMASLSHGRQGVESAKLQGSSRGGGEGGGSGNASQQLCKGTKEPQVGLQPVPSAPLLES